MFYTYQTYNSFLPDGLSIENPQQPHSLIIKNKGQIMCTNRIQRKKRVVKFPTNGRLGEVVALLQPSSTMSDTDRNSIWYQSSELELFKSSIRSATKLRRDSLVAGRRKFNVRSSPSLHKPQIPVSNGDDAENDCYRGLELRISSQRQKNKYVAIQAVLEAQRRFRKRAAFEAKCGRVTNPDELRNRLALISAKFTQSAREDALKLGFVDFVTAYSPSNLTDSTPPRKQKRRALQILDHQNSEKKARNDMNCTIVVPNCK